MKMSEYVRLARLVGTQPPDAPYDFRQYPSPDRIVALWQQTRGLTSAFANGTDPEPFEAWSVSKALKNTDRAFKRIGEEVVGQVGDYTLDLTVTKERVEGNVKKVQQLFPNDSLGQARYLALKYMAEKLRDTHSHNNYPELENNLPNPLAATYERLGNHSSDSILRCDPVQRVIPAYWSCRYMPNCLGNIIVMVAILRQLGLRFILATGLELVDVEREALEIEMLERALPMVARSNLVSGMLENGFKKLSDVRRRGTYNWMFHSAILVETDAENDEWALLDEYMDSSTELKDGIRFKKVADALDERKALLPGLAIPIRLQDGQAARQKALRRNLTLVERRYALLEDLYAREKRRVGGQISLDEFIELVARDPEGQRSLNWLMPRIFKTGKKKRGESLETFIARQENSTGAHPINWLISQFVGSGMIPAVHRVSWSLFDGGHPSLEVYADPIYALGVLVANAAVGSTGLATLSPRLLAYTSSQLIWHEAGIPDTTGNDAVVNAVRRTADEFVRVELPEKLLHPLVSHRRRLLDMRENRYGQNKETIC